MKKIFTYMLILSQFVIVPLSWGMGKKMESNQPSPANEQNQTEQSAASKLDTQDRDTMNQTTGFSGQTNSSMDLDTDNQVSPDQEDLDMKNQSNLPGQTGQTTSEAVTTGQGINSNQGTLSQTGLTGKRNSSDLNTQSTKSSGYTNPTGKSSTSRAY